MAINRIQGSSGSAYGIQQTKGSGGKDAGSSFQQQLSGQLAEDYRQRLEEILRDLDSQATAILERADLVKFEQYRARISQLLGELVQNGYRTKSERILSFRGSQRTYYSIHIIDQKLETLAKELVDRNLEQLTFLSRVDEIRGLIMDLLS
ncbi:hypothetical protein SDC9_62363 [bioreactor metagenome]|uniref:DUF327 domain-containing protein n=1 Tax=bioreactor metagenome TaxID=1076179 RepID=A0A644XIS1_9ZZZZ